MDSLRATNAYLEGVVPYDPKYLPAKVMISANENPEDIPVEVRRRVTAVLSNMAFNRYPDPLANELRDAIAETYGLSRDQVLVGNGGDELLYNISYAWGGPGRELLTCPPTFSTYAASAKLVGTRVVEIERLADYSLDEQAILDHLAQGNTDIVVICSPNNPTGNLMRIGFLEQLLEATDALVVVDEAYCEFAEETMEPFVRHHKNLAILRTFSKAYRLAGVRVGYLLASEEVVRELCKVRQPYSVDAVSQAIALQCWLARDSFAEGTQRIISERARVFEALDAMPEVEVFPSRANYLLMRVPNAFFVWERLFGMDILVRDFSAGELTKDCLRVSIGSPEENDRFLRALVYIFEEEREYIG